MLEGIPVAYQKRGRVGDAAQAIADQGVCSGVSKRPGHEPFGAQHDRTADRVASDGISGQGAVCDVGGCVQRAKVVEQVHETDLEPGRNEVVPLAEDGAGTRTQ